MYMYMYLDGIHVAQLSFVLGMLQMLYLDYHLQLLVNKTRQLYVHIHVHAYVWLTFWWGLCGHE